MRNKKSNYEQWEIGSGNRYTVCGATTLALPPGAYQCEVDCYGTPILRRHGLMVDDLIDISDSLANRILGEVDEFWEIGERFARYGFLHRRGYLFYGIQGSGKSSLIHQIISKIIDEGHVAFFCRQPHAFLHCAIQFRRVEPNRPMVCVFEDIDATIKEYGDSDLLQWLDGNCQVDNAVNLASTNYPERLDPRIVSRPRRFDRVLEIMMPTASQREAYLRRKLTDQTEAEILDWIDRTEGLSFASLAELVISVCCLANDLGETIEILRNQHVANQFTSADAEEQQAKTSDSLAV